MQPVQCEKCPLVIPSYSMAAHFGAEHGGADKMSAKLAAEVALAPHEADHVKQLLKVGTSRVKRAPCADAACKFSACNKKQKKK